MDFSNTTDKNGIIQNCEALCKLGDGGITGNAILFARFTGWVNDSYSKVAMAIMMVDKNWRWDDPNYANPNAFPVATTTLVSGQRSYLLPRATNASDTSTLWKVYKVRMKNVDGTWYDLEPLGSNDDETADGSGRPKYYRILGAQIRLSDPPTAQGVTLTGGIQVWFQREFVKFTTSSTTQNPGFMSSYHHLLYLDASATYLLPNDVNLANQYIALFMKELESLKDTVATRNDDPKNTQRMTPKIENTQ